MYQMSYHASLAEKKVMKLLKEIDVNAKNWCRKCCSKCLSI